MPGGVDPVYRAARRALLDAAQALDEHLPSLVLVGAQAVYLHTGPADLAVAEYTTDADLAIRPSDLADKPLIEVLMRAHGFREREHPGGWISPHRVYIDLMVPESLAGPGRRGARLGAHGHRVARRARGLEATLVDCQAMTIASLEPGDSRTVTMAVAGPGALLVAKTHKILERKGSGDRVRDKDALDVLRLLQAVGTGDLARRLALLETDPLSSEVTGAAIDALVPTFGRRHSEGVRMAVRAAGPGADEAFVAASMTTLTGDLVSALGRHG